MNLEQVKKGPLSKSSNETARMPMVLNLANELSVKMRPSVYSASHEVYIELETSAAFTKKMNLPQLVYKYEDHIDAGHGIMITLEWSSFERDGFSGDKLKISLGTNSFEIVQSPRPGYNEWLYEPMTIDGIPNSKFDAAWNAFKQLPTRSG